MSDTPAPTLSAPTSIRVKVLLPLPFSEGYDYLTPRNATILPIGSAVAVPLGPREVRGIVWSHAVDENVPAEKLKPITTHFDAPLLSADIIKFVNWVADYTMSPKGNVLRLVMRTGSVFDTIKQISAFQRADEIPSGLQLTDKRQAVLKLNTLATPQSVKEIAEAANVSEAVVRGLAKAGALEHTEINPDPAFLPLDPNLAGKPLSPDQQEAAHYICGLIKQGGYSTTLLDGVTGSGKTEVYLEAIASALQADPTAQACVLLPEIALTLPFLSRLEQRFGAPAAHWHSDVSAKARRRVWKRVADGNVRLVVGARSALFLPYANLKLIVVDEEHEAAYKQHEGVLYQGRDMAVARGALAGFPVILASATPSLETLANVEEGRYGYVKMASRFGPAKMPETQIVDMRQNPPERGEWLSPKVIEAVNQTLAKREQTLLYLNRRGYAPVTLCQKCGERMTAPESDTWLVEHRYTNRLVCHHTGYSIPKPDHCPHCNAADSLTACGPGVERIAEEAKAKWPNAHIEIFSSDSVLSPGAAKSLLERMTNGEIDILVATQAAAKGHNFPGLTLVAAVDADLGLAGGDLRAAERTFQTLSQVSGRAGRAEKPGRVLLQSYQPDNPVIQSLARQDRDGFAIAELQGRAALGFPPYGRLAAVILASEKETKLHEFARHLAQNVPHTEGVEVWGPAPAPLYRLRGTYRLRFLLKTTRTIKIQAVLSAWLGAIKTPSAIRRTIDIDPYSFN